MRFRRMLKRRHEVGRHWETRGVPSMGSLDLDKVLRARLLAYPNQGAGNLQGPITPAATPVHASVAVPDGTPVCDDALLDAAVEFIRDAEAARRGFAAGSGANLLVRLVTSFWWLVAMQALGVGLCLLAFLEPTPPLGGGNYTDNKPPFRWSVGVVELVVLLIYAFDQAVHVWAERHNRAHQDLKEAAVKAGGLKLRSRPRQGSQARANGVRSSGGGGGSINGDWRRWLVYSDKLWENVFLAEVALALVEWFVYYPAHCRMYFRWSRALRPLFFITKSERLRRYLARIIRTFGRLAQVAALFFILVVFWGVLGMQLFNSNQVPGYDNNNDNFNDFGAAFLLIYIESTTENVPQVMYPPLAARPVVALIFFILSIGIFLWLVLPMFLAIAYDYFKDVSENAERKQEAKSLPSLLVAYKLVCLVAARRRGDWPVTPAAFLLTQPDTSALAAAAAATSLNGGPTAAAAASASGGAAARLLPDTIPQLNPAKPSDRSSFATLLQRAYNLHRAAAGAMLGALDVDGGGADGSLTALEFLALPKLVNLAPPGMRSGGHGWCQGTLCIRVCGCCRREHVHDDEADEHVVFGSEALAGRSGKRRSGPGAELAEGLLQRGSGDAEQPSVEWGFSTFSSFRDDRSGVALGVAGGAGGSAAAAGDPRFQTVPFPWCCCRPGRFARAVRWSQRLLYTGLTHWVLYAAVFGSAVAACMWSTTQQNKFNHCLKVHGGSAWPHCARHEVMVQEYIAVICLSIGAAEVVLRSTAGGGLWAWLGASAWNGFDLLVVVWSLGASVATLLGIKQHIAPEAMDWLEFTRALRILRGVSTFPFLRSFLTGLSNSPAGSVLGMTGNFVILYAGISFTFAVIGQFLFASVDPNDPDRPQNYSFRYLGESMLLMFQISTGNNVNDVMYPNAERSFWKALFFVIYYFACTDVLQNLITGAIIDLYEAAQREKEQQRVRLALLGSTSAQFAASGGGGAAAAALLGLDASDDLGEDGGANPLVLPDPVGVLLPPLVGGEYGFTLGQLGRGWWFTATSIVAPCCLGCRCGCCGDSEAKLGLIATSGRGAHDDASLRTLRSRLAAAGDDRDGSYVALDAAAVGVVQGGDAVSGDSASGEEGGPSAEGEGGADVVGALPPARHRHHHKRSLVRRRSAAAFGRSATEIRAYMDQMKAGIRRAVEAGDPACQEGADHRGDLTRHEAALLRRELGDVLQG